MLLRFAACATLFALLALVHPALRAAPHVAVGANHVCVITPSGGVRCMGRNAEGQLGDGSVVPRTLPTDTAATDDTGTPLQDVVLVAAGHHHSCAATAAGAVYCWGANSHGELGTGDTAPRTRPARVQFDHGTGPLAGLAVGEAHTCVIEQAGGQVDCWGSNGDGQVGDGTTTDRPAPVAVSLAGSPSATVLALGRTHSCALVLIGSARAVQCWGANIHGELGRDTSAEAAPFAPAAVAGLSPALMLLAAGDHHTCSTDASGAPVCWGANARGQLGVGGSDDTASPTPVKGFVGTAMAMALGSNHSCIASEWGAQCWGSNDAGQRGIGSFTSSDTADTAAGTPFFPGDEAAAGADTTCVLGGPDHVALRCWGSDYFGQFGNGTVGFHTTPVFTAELFDGGAGPLEEIAAGSYHTCALTGSTVRCWGLNTDGELGVFAPSPFAALPWPVTAPNTHATHIVLGAYHGCYNGWSESACWGFNAYGQIGNGNTLSQPYPSPIAPAASFGEEMTWTAGANHTCGAIGGVLHCWGDNTWSQLGDGTTHPQALPHPVSLANGASAAQVSAGSFETCATTTEGGLQCWGTESVGANPTSPSPQPHVLPTGVLADEVALGFSHGCILTEAGDVRCWGDNTYGQLGIGSFDAQTDPVLVSIPALGIVHMATGSESLHTCAIDANAGVWCWGVNGNGQLGDGTLADSNLPVHASGLATSAAQVTVGAAHTCIRPEFGTRAVCWGDNAYGQLGNGEHGYWPTPDNGVFVDRLFADGFEGDGAGQ